MKRTTCLLAATVIVATGTPALWAEHNDNHLSAAEIFIEINDTDGDAGIQLFLDGEGWDTMTVWNPSGEIIFTVAGDGAVGQQGITELFFESAEPSFDEQPLDEFLSLNPEGVYRFRGSSTEGELLRGHATLTHALPDAPILVFPGEEEEVEPSGLVLEWMTVPDPPGGRIIGYHVVLEREEPDRTLAVDLARNTTRLEVPRAFLQRGIDLKFEVLAIERSGNKTITEREFSIAE